MTASTNDVTHLSKPLRLFVALTPNEEMRKALALVQTDWKSQLPHGMVRWVSAANIHLTLQFLGDVPGDAVPDIEEGLRTTVTGSAPFALHLGSCGCFPNVQRPRVLWVGVGVEGELEALEALQALQTAVSRSLAGWNTKNHVFNPHLTLGRIKGGPHAHSLPSRGRPEVLRPAPLVWPVGHVELMRSDLLPFGPVYTRLGSFGLRG